MDTYLLIVGSRGWADAQLVEERLAAEYAEVGRDHLVVVHDNARGVGRIVGDWCDRWHVYHRGFDLDLRHERFAVQRRNVDMLNFVAEQRAEFGAQVKVVVFRHENYPHEADHVVALARGRGMHGTLVKAA